MTGRRSSAGRKRHAATAATRAKISKSLRGRHHKGRKLTAATRAKLAKARKGKRHPHKGHKGPHRRGWHSHRRKGLKHPHKGSHGHRKSHRRGSARTVHHTGRRRLVHRRAGSRHAQRIQRATARTRYLLDLTSHRR